MTYYIYKDEENNLNGAGEVIDLTEGFESIQVTKELFENYIETPDKYIYQEGEIIIDPDYEEKQKQKERKRLDGLSLTPADVERALYKAKGMDFEDLKALIAQQIPTIDLKALAIEFRAKDFYRGAMARGMRLFDTVGALLGYSSDDMDKLFLTKELPNANSTNTAE